MVSTRLAAGWELPATSDQSALKSYLTAGKPANRQAVFDALESVAVAPRLGDQSQKIQDAVNNALGEIAAGRAKTAPALKQGAATVDGLLG
jgi:multiple sugar transport system substrate-binding protein